ncbi:hypothetical protein JOM56_008322 [Amanita muscaria]
MHPYPFHYYRPSRAFWFILGAASAALWIKHREYNRVNGTSYGHCIRQRQIPQGSPSMRVDGPTPETPSASVTSSDPLQSIDVCQTFSRAIFNTLSAFGERKQLERWEEDKAKLKDLTSRATDTIAEMSESTLDALLANLESLKAKIVEQRSQRDKQRKQFDAKLEAEI